MLKRIIFSVLWMLGIGAVGYYFVLPPFHIKSSEFWGFLIFLAAVFFVCFFFASIKSMLKSPQREPKKFRIKKPENKKIRIILTGVIFVVIASAVAIFI